MKVLLYQQESDSSSHTAHQNKSMSLLQVVTAMGHNKNFTGKMEWHLSNLGGYHVSTAGDHSCFEQKQN